MKLFRLPKSQATSAALFATGLLLAPTARAQDHGDAAYSAWTSAFLVKKDLGKNTGMTFFAKALTGPDHNVPDDNWRLAFHIMVVEDTYLHTRKPEQLKLIDTLLSDYMKFYGTDFSSDNWNDDLGWISIAFVRGYQITGQQKYLDLSAHVWNLAYNRDWDTTLGGGIWENRKDRPGKEALSNNPFIISGVALYEATQDKQYLTKATAIYDWVRKNLFDTTTGQVNQGMNPPATLSRGENVYNSGTFIVAANNLHRVLGTAGYNDDAQKAIDFVINKKGPILHDSDNTGNALWAYWFIKALTEFCNANNKWPQYQSYLDNNAQSSWANRNTQSNLTGNDWTKVYAYTNTDQVGPMPSDSGVAIWQLIVPNVSAAAGAGGSGGTAGGTAGGDDAGPAAGGAGGSGGSMATGAGTGGMSGSAGSAAGGGSVAPTDGGSAALAGGGAGSAASSASHSPSSGCGCVVGANRVPGGLALSGLAGLLLLVASRRRQSVRSVRSRARAAVK